MTSTTAASQDHAREQSDQSADRRPFAAPWSALSIDVEVDPAENNRIFLIGAARWDSPQHLSLRVGKLNKAEIIRRVDHLLRVDGV